MMSDNFVKKIASATGHTNSVTSLRFSHSPNKPFIVSGSVDMTLKIWSLSEVISHSIDEL